LHNKIGPAFCAVQFWHYPASPQTRQIKQACSILGRKVQVFSGLPQGEQGFTGLALLLLAKMHPEVADVS